MKKGDSVLYDGEIATFIKSFISKCRCRGMGYHLLELGDGQIKKVPLSTVLKPYKKQGIDIKLNIQTHQLT